MRKKKVLLTAIILFGLFLRVYNLNSPSIGYHNMKENEYLSIAQEMQRTQDFITRRVYFYNAFDDVPIMKIYPQIPLISYQTLIAWKFFGHNMWAPRLCNVIFGALSILIIYAITNLLFNNITLALFSAFLLAIMPLSVFFSRNLQPEGPAFFFMLLGNLFYLRFCHCFKKSNLILGGLCFSTAWLYKSTFIFGIIPFLVCFDFKTILKERRNNPKLILAALLPYLILSVSIIWFNYSGQWKFQELNRINIFSLFSPLYWQTYGRRIWDYTFIENFAMLPLFAAFLGIFTALCKRKTLIERYIIGWALAIVFYCIIFSDFINQHNYYQMPFLALICIAAAYAALFISGQIKKLFKIDALKFTTLYIALAAMPFAFSSLLAMHDKVFWATDTAGESLKEFTKPQERIFLYTHGQGYGIARYAHRYMGWPKTLAEFKANEKKFSIKYACFYPSFFITNLKKKSPEFFEYIDSNYHIKEEGFIKTGKKNNPAYLILEKNNGLNFTDVSGFTQKTIKLQKTYRIFGKPTSCYSLRYLNISEKNMEIR